MKKEMLNVEFFHSEIPVTGVVVLLCGSGLSLGHFASKIDSLTEGAVSRSIKAMNFNAKCGEILVVPAPANSALKKVLVLGLGNLDEITLLSVEKAGGALAGNLVDACDTDVAILPDAMDVQYIETAEVAAYMAYAMVVRSYHYDLYKTAKQEEKKARLERVQVLLAEAEEANRIYQALTPLIEGISFCRDLVNAPANVLNPETYAAKIDALNIPGLDIEILDEQQLSTLGMGALLAVGQGSEKESRVAILKWVGVPESEEIPIALVGKGVTFDSGGLSLKPGKGMEDMKTDMGGSAVVVGSLITLARRRAKTNVVGIVGLVENMPSHIAYRPSDVLSSHSGKTIEVLNTDAEGRLVLADCLSYVEQRFKPGTIIDLATLTGAIVVALGNEYGGLFSNSDSLTKSLLNAAEKTGEMLWPMPMSEAYDKQLDSKVADIQNLESKPGASSSVAAHFLKRFVRDAEWAHLDIAGMVWKGEPDYRQAYGASGYGVRLMDALISDAFENR